MCSLAQMVNISSDIRLPSVALDDPAAVSGRAAIDAIITKNLRGPAALLASFVRDYASLVTMQVCSATLLLSHTHTYDPQLQTPLPVRRSQRAQMQSRERTQAKRAQKHARMPKAG